MEQQNIIDVVERNLEGAESVSIDKKVKLTPMSINNVNENYINGRKKIIEQVEQHTDEEEQTVNKVENKNEQRDNFNDIELSRVNTDMVYEKRTKLIKLADHMMENIDNKYSISDNQIDVSKLNTSDISSTVNESFNLESDTEFKDNSTLSETTLNDNSSTLDELVSLSSDDKDNISVDIPRAFEDISFEMDNTIPEFTKPSSETIIPEINGIRNEIKDSFEENTIEGTINDSIFDSEITDSIENEAEEEKIYSAIDNSTVDELSKLRELKEKYANSKMKNKQLRETYGEKQIELGEAQKRVEGLKNAKQEKLDIVMRKLEANEEANRELESVIGQVNEEINHTNNVGNQEEHFISELVEMIDSGKDSVIEERGPRKAA